MPTPLLSFPNENQTIGIFDLFNSFRKDQTVAKHQIASLQLMQFPEIYPTHKFQFRLAHLLQMSGGEKQKHVTNIWRQN